MSKKAIRLIIWVFILAAANVLVAFWEPGRQNLNFDPTAYAVTDTSAYVSMSFTFNAQQNRIERTTNGWELNNRYKVDRNLLRVFQSVMQQIRIKRKLGETELTELTQRLKNDGTRVDLTLNEGKLIFHILGNEMMTKTYALSEDLSEGFEVEIPGYNDYLGSIFALKTSQWRDRTIFSGNWRTIQSLAIDYSSDKYGDLEIWFEDDFFKVKGVNAIDSNQVVGYFEQFQYLQANEMIEKGAYERYDSLTETTPFLKMKINDIKLEESYEITIFPPLENEKILLVTDNKGNMMVFDENRIQNYFAQPQDFIYQPQ